jgi:hypothetical protein
MPNSLEDLSVDQLLQVAQRGLNSEQMLNGLYNDPATREDLLRLMKKKNPGLTIPEIDAKDDVLGRVETSNKRVADLENKLAERDIRDRVTAEKTRVKNFYQLSDADMGEVEKLMIDENEPIPSYAAAAKVFVASRTQAMPTSSSLSPPVFDMPDKNIWAGGIGNRAGLDKIALNEAYRALNEIKSGKVAGT